MRIALVGQPNCGKSTLFNAVAGYRSIAANFPGSTVHYARSRVSLNGSVAELIDLPGTYSLTSSSPAESATRDFLLNERPDVIINVIDTATLARGLDLTLELAELGLPLVVCLNMIDEARRRGIRVDRTRLSEMLRLPVQETIALDGVGVRPLFQKAWEISHRPRLDSVEPCFQTETECVIEEVRTRLAACQDGLCRGCPRLGAIKVLEGDDAFFPDRLEDAHLLVQESRDRLARTYGKPADEVIASERHTRALHIYESSTELDVPPEDFRDRLDDWLTHPYWGYVILLGCLGLFFGLVYGVGSRLEGPILSFFEGLSQAFLKNIPSESWAFPFLKGLMQGVSGGLAIVLPYLVPFLFGMAFLEDVGYLPRVAFLMDAFLHRIGLHGTAIVPAILGYGCSVPAVMATRILGSPRDRFIASVISTLVPCSARMAVILALVAFYLGPVWAFAIYLINVLAVAASGKALSSLLPEASPGLILEVPRYNLPRLGMLLQKTWFRLREFIEIGWPLLVVGSIALSFIEFGHWDGIINQVLSPLTALLGLPAVTGTTLIFGLLRKELTLLMLFQALGTTDVLSVMTASQVFVFAVFTTFYVPCVATVAALAKELGWRLTAAVVAYSLFLALAISLAVRLVFGLLPPV
ncbi:MAG: ferrous iron transport protein B [Acidobacteriota bacterium]